MYSFSVSCAVVAAFSCLTHTTFALNILDSQCWSETILRTAELQSYKTSTSARTVEVIEPISTVVRPFISFHLPWPWSFQPLCTSPLPSTRAPLCVYTSTSFASNRGISIVTTPKLAAHVASLPAFTNPSSLQNDGTNTPTGLWFTSSIPSKGTGTLALHNLTPGTQILRYTPAFLAYLEADLSTLDRESLWRTAITRLPAPTRSSFLSLMYIYGDPRVRHQDIVKGNTFQLDIRGVNHLAVFPETSRLNHDCAPNAQYVIDPVTLTHTVRVVRDIPEGEEISIAYKNPLERGDVRRAKLAEGFHFDCACQRCRDEEKSEAVLDRIGEIQGQLNDWSGESKATPQMAEHLVSLYEEEGLQGFLDVPYGFAALAFNAVGRAEEARIWAKKAREAVLLKDGEGADALRIWDSLLKDAEGHWSYRRRS